MDRLRVADRPSLHRGDYVCSEKDLYCVEEIAAGRVLLEDCRTGALIEMRLSWLFDMARVMPAADSAAAATVHV